jgi:hypothetical protein
LHIALKQNEINRREGNKLFFDFQVVPILFDPRLAIEVTSISLILRYMLREAIEICIFGV